MSADKAIGVRPAARRSPTNTMEIIPSGRTGTVPESCCSCHTVICKESSAPITYRSGSIGPPVLAGVAPAAVPGGAVADGCFGSAVAEDELAGGADADVDGAADEAAG